VFKRNQKRTVRRFGRGLGHLSIALVAVAIGLILAILLMAVTFKFVIN